MCQHIYWRKREKKQDSKSYLNAKFTIFKVINSFRLYMIKSVLWVPLVGSAVDEAGVKEERKDYSICFVLACKHLSVCPNITRIHRTSSLRVRVVVVWCTNNPTPPAPCRTYLHLMKEKIESCYTSHSWISRQQSYETNWYIYIIRIANHKIINVYFLYNQIMIKLQVVLTAEKMYTRKKIKWFTRVGMLVTRTGATHTHTSRWILWILACSSMSPWAENPGAGVRAVQKTRAADLMACMHLGGACANPIVMFM
jgi:hypothetical protein